jgi:hypothetical protein
VRPVLGSAARSHAHSVLQRGVAVRANPVADRVVVAAVPQLFERSLQGVVGELVRAARRGEEVTCAAIRPESRAIAEIAIRREPGRANPRDGAGRDLAAEDSDTLRMETVREVVHCHGGWMKTRGTEGRLDSVTMFWPLWEPPVQGAA